MSDAVESAGGSVDNVAQSILAKLNTPSAPSEDKAEEAETETEAQEPPEESDTAEGASDEATPETDPDPPAESDDDTLEVFGEKITRKEWKARGLRQSDYTKKTQALAAKERELQERGQGYETERKQSKDQLDQILSFVQTVDPLKAYEKLDWMQLARDDQANGTNNYTLLRAQYDQLKEGMDRLFAVTRAQRDKEQAEVRDKMQAWGKSQAEQIIEKFPDLRDPKKAKAVTAELDAYAENLGFTKEELTSQWLFRDARMWQVFRDANAYQKQEAARKSAGTKKTNQPPAVIKPKGGEAKVSGTSEKRAFNRQFKEARSDRERAEAIIARLHRS